MKRIFSVLLVLCTLVCLVPMQAMADEFDDYFGNGDDNLLYVMVAWMTEDYVPVGEGYSYIEASADTTVDLKHYVPSGYEIVRVEVQGDTSSFAVDSNWCFKMPDAPGEMVAFVTPGGNNPGDGDTPGGGGTATEYKIERGTISHGSVLFSAETASANTTVTITSEAHDGYALNVIAVTDSNNNVITLNKNGNNYEFKMPASDVRVDAYFVPAITVTFEYNDGVSPARPIQVPQGGSLSEIPTPTRDGYVFLGWYKTDNTKVDTSIKFNESTTVHARWIKAEHTTVSGNNGYLAGIGMGDQAILDLLNRNGKLKLDAGENIKVYLKVTKESETTVPADDQSAIKAKAGVDTVASYLDIKLLQQVGEQEPAVISNTGEGIPISMTVDEGVIPANAGNIRIIYYHNGVAKTLDATYNAATRSLTFNAYEFSTYALVYTPNAGSAVSGGTLDNVPKTGEASGLSGWIAMALCCTAMLACVSIYDKKRTR